MYKLLIISIIILVYTLYINFITSYLNGYETIIRMNNRAFCEEGFFYHYKRPLTIKQVRESEKVCPKL